MIGDESGSISGIQITRSVSCKLPLIDRGVQTIAAVENVRMRHVTQIFLSESPRIHSWPVGIPRAALLNNGVRAVRFCRRVEQRAENAHISKLTGVWSSVGIDR